MTHVLVTFLGAPDTGRPPSLRKRRGYQEVIYEFAGSGGSSDTKHYRERFFPLALRDYLDESGQRVEKLVIFGTPGSAWDEFLLYVGIPSLRLADIDALRREIERNAVEGTRLQTEWADRVKAALHLKKQEGVQLKVIKDYAEKTGKQVEMIARLAEAAEDATEVTFDVTHGLRYLPLLGSLAAYVVNSKGKVPVNVWYGAYDMRKANGLGEEIAPAINLAGLSRIVDWLAAFKNFEWDGDYWAFADVLKEDDNDENDPGKLLAQAAFFERIGRFREAEVKFKAFDTAVDARVGKESAAHSMINLFKEDLSRRIALSKVSDEQLYEHQCALARHHLNHEDVVHAAIWGREAAVTRVTIDRYNQLRKPSELGLKRDHALRSFDVRREANRIYCKESSDTKHDAYKRILGIRNKLAHAVDDLVTPTDDVNRDVVAALESPGKCKEKLEEYFNEFGLPDPAKKSAAK